MRRQEAELLFEVLADTLDDLLVPETSRLAAGRLTENGGVLLSRLVESEIRGFEGFNTARQRRETLKSRLHT